MQKPIETYSYYLEVQRQMMAKIIKSFGVPKDKLQGPSSYSSYRVTSAQKSETSQEK